MGWKAIEIAASLPQLTDKSALCFEDSPIKTTECKKLVAQYDLALKQINNMKIYAMWAFVMYMLPYINVQYLFSVKYWVLSLKLESLMFREKNLSLRTIMIVNIIIVSLEVILLTSLTLLIVYIYYVVNDQVR
jgi:hypothetical protein